jgi:hypothetical protein
MGRDPGEGNRRPVLRATADLGRGSNPLQRTPADPPHGIQRTGLRDQHGTRQDPGRPASMVRLARQHSRPGQCPQRQDLRWGRERVGGFLYAGDGRRIQGTGGSEGARTPRILLRPRSPEKGQHRELRILPGQFRDPTPRSRILTSWRSSPTRTGSLPFPFPSSTRATKGPSTPATDTTGASIPTWSRMRQNSI